MFSISLGALLTHSILNLLFPLLPGILFLWLFFGTKVRGVLLYLLGRFIGVGVVANFVFDLQFIRFSIGSIPYLLLLVLLIILLAIKLVIKKGPTISEYIQSLRVQINLKEVCDSYKDSSKYYKVLTRGMGTLIVWFLASSFVFTTSVPTYADDSFSNRNRPILNILHDGGVHMFGEQEQVLGRGTTGYPIHVAIYKASIAKIAGGYSDIYTDLFQRFALALCMLFLCVITRHHTKNIFYALLPAAVLTTLPLLFIHTVESYHDLPVTIYAVIAAWLLYKFLTTREMHFLILSILVSFIMSYIKIEGLIIYAGALVISLILYLLYDKAVCKEILKTLRGSWLRLRDSAILFLLFFLPFQIVRMSHGLGFNPSSIESGSVLDKQVHREIFSVFKSIFLGQDNYGVALMIFFFVCLMVPTLHKKRKPMLYFLLASVVMFVLFTLVFLLTNNYQRALSQTTINRVYTMCFVVIFSFIGLYAYERKAK